jgi:hypothetical protein
MYVFLIVQDCEMLPNKSGFSKLKALMVVNLSQMFVFTDLGADIQN